MKKIIGIFCGLIVSCSAFANEEKEEKPVLPNHMFYIGHSGEEAWNHVTTLGYRYYWNDMILDTSLGYNAFRTYARDSLYLLKGTASALYKFKEDALGHLYTGVGVDCTSYNYGKFSSNVEIMPYATLGREFIVHKTKKIFLEVFYKPVSFQKHKTRSIHNVGYRVGFGF